MILEGAVESTQYDLHFFEKAIQRAIERPIGTGKGCQIHERREHRRGRQHWRGSSLSIRHRFDRRKALGQTGGRHFRLLQLRLQRIDVEDLLLQAANASLPQRPQLFGKLLYQQARRPHQAVPQNRRRRLTTARRRRRKRRQLFRRRRQEDSSQDH